MYIVHAERLSLHLSLSVVHPHQISGRRFVSVCGLRSGREARMWKICIDLLLRWLPIDNWTCKIKWWMRFCQGGEYREQDSEPALSRHFRSPSRSLPLDYHLVYQWSWLMTCYSRSRTTWLELRIGFFSHLDPHYRHYHIAVRFDRWTHIVCQWMHTHAYPQLTHGQTAVVSCFSVERIRWEASACLVNAISVAVAVVHLKALHIAKLPLAIESISFQVASDASPQYTTNEWITSKNDESTDG